MKGIISALILLQSFTSFAQTSVSIKTHADSVEHLKNIIISSNTLAGQRVGFAGSPSPQWYSYAYLAKICTVNELLKLSKSKHAALKVYAYMALIYLNYTQINKVKADLLKDTSALTTMQGCIINRSTIGQHISFIEPVYVRQSLDNFYNNIYFDKKKRVAIFNCLVQGKAIKHY